MAKTNPFTFFRVLTATTLFAGTMFLTAAANPAPEAAAGPSGVSIILPEPSAPSVSPEAASAPVESVAPAPSTTQQRTPVVVNVVGSIADVDRCEGLTLWDATLPNEPQVIAAHDLCDVVKPWDPSAIGGLKAYGHVQVGEAVKVSGSAAGLRSGDYVASQRVVVPTGTDFETALQEFHTAPKVILQTCIPNTATTLLIGLQ